ncbi:MAG: DNA polymerase elongation subunit (family B), partial [Candidatus Thermoplasmatota archaeon]
MDKTLLGVSPDYLYFIDEKPKSVSDFHKPYFYVFSSRDNDIHSSRRRLVKKWKNCGSDDVLSKIDDIGEVEKRRGFWDYGLERDVFKVYAKRSYFVPEITDFLFFRFGLYTGEHDIAYQKRVATDLAAEDKAWVFDTQGKKETAKVLVYDIETTQYEEGKKEVPIDIIGWSSFDIGFQSEKDLENENFSFDIADCPDSWEEPEINQLVSHNLDEEVENLLSFCKTLMNSDIISGHNILGFDNLQIYTRIKWFLQNRASTLSKNQRKTFETFLDRYCRSDQSYHFGTRSDVLQFYPSSLDTFLGARKFYSFLNDFSLKGLAPFLDIKLDDRLVLKPSEMDIDKRTIRYNKQDVQEQLGVTLNIIQQALPLSFTTGMPFDLLFSSGAVQMWDYMSLIRGHRQRKIMPPICRVMSLCKQLQKDFEGYGSRNELAEMARNREQTLSKEFKRVVKYGEEMPGWVMNPEVVYNKDAKDADERLAYHMPGGMTIKPDSDANSHFIPWWNVIVADVGAMYPTILKAMNIGADTVRLSKKNEKPDYWIWLKKIPGSFLKGNDVKWRQVGEKDGFADEGYMVGVKIDEKQGVVNTAMTGILNMINKIKKELNEAKEKGVSDAELKRLKMMYQSVKGARNAG